SFIVGDLWKEFSRDQRERYLKAQMTHFIQQRAGYPPEPEARRSGRKLYSTWGGEGWAPQMRTTDKNGKGGSLHTPAWKLFDPLPVDLCFRTEFRIEG